MAKAKQLGHRAKFFINAAQVGFVKSITPNAMTREKIDVTDLDANFMQFLDGDIPDLGEITITCAWDPADAGDAAIDTIFLDPDLPDREKDCILIYYRALKQDSFKARILSITPAAMESKKEVTRDIKLVLTTAVTRSTYTPA